MVYIGQTREGCAESIAARLLCALMQTGVLVLSGYKHIYNNY